MTLTTEVEKYLTQDQLDSLSVGDRIGVCRQGLTEQYFVHTIDRITSSRQMLVDNMKYRKTGECIKDSSFFLVNPDYAQQMINSQSQ